MASKSEDVELTNWFSTYGLVTAERLLAYYQFKLSLADLLKVAKTPDCFYHQLLQVPIKNILNGIILQQAKDYQVYAQKLYIDYLLSGEAGREDEAAGGHTRQELEEERQNLIKNSEDFENAEDEHFMLISNSQRQLLAFARQWHETAAKWLDEASYLLADRGKDYSMSAMEKMINQLLLLPREAVFAELLKDEDYLKKLAEITRLSKEDTEIQFSALIECSPNLMDETLDLENMMIQTRQMAIQLSGFRAKFYETILKTTDLLTHLPEYRLDMEDLAEKKENLFFDRSLGEAEG